MTTQTVHWAEAGEDEREWAGEVSGPEQKLERGRDGSQDVECDVGADHEIHLQNHNATNIHRIIHVGRCAYDAAYR